MAKGALRPCGSVPSGWGLDQTEVEMGVADDGCEGPVMGPFGRLASQRWLLTALTSWVALVACGGSPAPTGSSDGLRVGVLFDESGPLGEFGRTGRSGIELALAHVNAAGGVLGQPVTVASADGATDVAVTVSGARALVEDGVHVLIGPLGSAAALAVISEVSSVSRIPTLSPTATAPSLSTAADEGFFFRATASDAAQAPVLARLATEEGYQHVGIAYQDDAYGRGLAEAFQGAFGGRVSMAAVAPEEDEIDAVLASLSADAEVLLLMTPIPTAAALVQGSLASGAFDRFLFVDSTASTDLLIAVGDQALEGMKGTAPAGAVPELGPAAVAAQADAFHAAYEASFGTPPHSGLEATAYDLVVCVCLAAELAGSTDGEAIRDRLPEACGRGGASYGPGSEGVAAALEAARGGDAVDFDGGSGTLDWDDRGDLANGSVVIWQFANGTIEPLEHVHFGA